MPAGKDALKILADSAGDGPGCWMAAIFCLLHGGAESGCLSSVCPWETSHLDSQDAEAVFAWRISPQKFWSRGGQDLGWDLVTTQETLSLEEMREAAAYTIALVSHSWKYLPSVVLIPCEGCGHLAQ